jgi:hypothetical protein
MLSFIQSERYHILLSAATFVFFLPLCTTLFSVSICPIYAGCPTYVINKYNMRFYHVIVCMHLENRMVEGVKMFSFH